LITVPKIDRLIAGFLFSRPATARGIVAFGVPIVTRLAANFGHRDLKGEGIASIWSQIA